MGSGESASGRDGGRGRGGCALPREHIRKWASPLSQPPLPVISDCVHQELIFGCNEDNELLWPLAFQVVSGSSSHFVEAGEEARFTKRADLCLPVNSRSSRAGCREPGNDVVTWNTPPESGIGGVMSRHAPPFKAP